ncbi:MAG: hypothetical protein KAW92_09595 [Candidatus Cloacimonetes bacterium]|nr:hypothetical protein [Candidatus Cloacimonadota bacterium]
MWSWIAGTVSILILILMGRKYWWAPIAGFISQSAWFIYVFVDKQYGLLLCVIAYTIVHIINARKWYRDWKVKKGEMIK